MLRGHGNDKYNYSNQVLADFSSNVWYKHLPDWFYKELAGTLKKTIDYPHPSAGDFVKALSSHLNLTRSNILATNGSVEGMFLLAQTFEKRKTAVIYPGFAEYEDACKRYNHQLNFYKNQENWHQLKFNEDIIFFGNPNNPDGKWISVHEVEALLIANPKSIIIIDEAFAELCSGFLSSIPLIHKYENLVILRSFTKTFAIPGIRLGCILGNDKIINRVKQLTIPWSVNSLAIEAGKLILENYPDLLPDEKELTLGRKYLHEKLSKITGLELTPSGCNFVLAEIKKGNAADLKKYLAEEYQILIRDASNFKGLSEKHFRISVQNNEHIDLLTEGIESYLEHQ